MRQAASLAIVSTINLAMAFAHQWYVVVQLGASVETDALFAGMTIPTVVLTIISGSVMHVLVPILSGESRHDVQRDAWSLLYLLGGLFIGLFALLYITADLWVPFAVPGFNVEGQALTIELTRIQLVGMVLSVVNGVQWAVYHARQKFIWAEITPLFATIVSFALLIWLLPTFGIVLVAWLSVFRLVLQTLFLSPEMGMPVKPNFKSVAIVQGWSRIKPLLLGAAYYKTDIIVDRVLLSMATSGSLTLFYMAQRIYGAIGQILNKSLIAPLVPRLSTLSKEGKRKDFKQVAYQRLYQVFFLTLMGTVFFYFLADTAAVWMSEVTGFSLASLKMLLLLLLLMCGQFIIGNLGAVLTIMFYAQGETRAPTLVGVQAYTAGICIKVLLFYLYGIEGLALGVSLYYIVALVMMIRAYRGYILNGGK